MFKNFKYKDENFKQHYKLLQTIFFHATAPNGTKHQRKQHKTLPFWSITNDACPSFIASF